MKIVTYFCSKYVSSNKEEYVKVSIELVDRGVERGMFAAIYNPVTKTTQAQRSNYSYNKRNTRNLIGKNGSEWEIDDDFYTAWSKYSPEVKEGFRNCINHLKSSFSRYCQIDDLEDNDKKEVKDYLDALCHDKIFVSSKKEENPVWKQADINLFNSHDLSEITSLITSNGNPGEGVEYNGKRYRLIEKENGFVSLEILENGCSIVENKEEVPAPVPENTRKFIQMAKIVNANGLNDIVVGNFYLIDGTVNKNNKSYVTIKIDENEYRTILQERVKLVNVYTEKPVEALTK